MFWEFGKLVPVVVAGLLLLHALVKQHQAYSAFSFPSGALVLLILFATPGLICNKIDDRDISLFTTIALMLVPLSGRLAAEKGTRLNGK
ncbi:MAG TPA: hypothetical protein VH518_05560, partial [Tepidisphaeraceae bacterium]